MIREKSAKEKFAKDQAKLPAGVIAVAPPSFRRDRIDTACDCDAVIGGDGLVMSIAAASIIAKVTRDRLMCALAQDCPGYGFESHKGYSVPEHLEALDRLGPSVHHRSFFAPVIAAREKHQPRTIKREPDMFAETQIDVDVSSAI